MSTRKSVITSYYLNNSSEQIILNIKMLPPGITCTTTIKIAGQDVLNKGKGNINMQVGANNELKNKLMLIATTISNTTSDAVVVEYTMEIKRGIIDRKYVINTASLAEKKSITIYSEIQFL